jgi:hypothetical protein
MAYALEQDNYRSKRSYLSTGPFQNNIYSYVTSLNPTTFRQEGKLAVITTTPAGAALSATNCPGGRVLRENGRKLYPGVNPGLAVGDTYQGAVVGTTTTNHVWVGVFDAITGVKGFINPNNATFSVFNSDKPLEVVDQDELTTAGVTDDIVTSGQLRSSSITTNSTATGGTLTINPSLGQVFRFTATMTLGVVLAATAGTAVAQPGAVVYVIFTNGGGQTIVGDNSTVLGAASATMTTAKTYAVTLVSNGVTFVQTSAVQGF